MRILIFIAMFVFVSFIGIYYYKKSKNEKISRDQPLNQDKPLDQGATKPMKVVDTTINTNANDPSTDWNRVADIIGISEKLVKIKEHVTAFMLVPSFKIKMETEAKVNGITINQQAILDAINQFYVKGIQYFIELLKPELLSIITPERRREINNLIRNYNIRIDYLNNNNYGLTDDEYNNIFNLFIKSWEK